MPAPNPEITSVATTIPTISPMSVPSYLKLNHDMIHTYKTTSRALSSTIHPSTTSSSSSKSRSISRFPLITSSPRVCFTPTRPNNCPRFQSGTWSILRCKWICSLIYTPTTTASTTTTATTTISQCDTFPTYPSKPCAQGFWDWSRSSCSWKCPAPVTDPCPVIPPRPNTHCPSHIWDIDFATCSWICRPGEVECILRPPQPLTLCPSGGLWKYDSTKCTWFCPIPKEACLNRPPRPRLSCVWVEESCDWICLDEGIDPPVGISCDRPKPSASSCIPAGLWSCDFLTHTWQCQRCAVADGFDCLP